MNKRANQISVVLISGFLNLWSVQGFCAAQVTGIEFRGATDPSQIEIKTNGPVKFEKLENTEDHQLVVELKGATLPKYIARKIDTSSFSGNVNLISPYQVEGQDSVRVVVQMRKSGVGQVSQDGNTIRIAVPMGAAADNAPTDEPPAQAAPQEPPASPQGSDSVVTPPEVESVSKTQSTNAAAAAQVPAKGPKGRLEQWNESKVTQRFVGKSITLQARDVDVADIFRLLGDASGFNILLAEDVKGKMTLSLVDVPWDQALDLVLHTMHLGAERNNNILRVSTLSAIRQEKTEELMTAQASQAATPRITRIFTISYGNIAELKTAVERIAESSSATLIKPLVIVDSRTNSLIVQDYAANMDKIKKLIEILDTQTPQVLIEAKVIEASEIFSKQLNGGVGAGFSSFGFAANNNPFQSLVASGVPLGFPAFANTGIAGGTVPSVSFIPGMQRLNALFSWGESESFIKVIASPKTVVLNGQKATIRQGTGYVKSVVVQTQNGPVQEDVSDTTNLSLEVTPTVNSDGNVLLNLKLNRPLVQPLPRNLFAAADRFIETLVMVESGSTLVIGGVYSAEESATTAGIPWLSKIPIFGAFFGSQNQSSNKTELFFFITPRVLNAKEAGLSG